MKRILLGLLFLLWGLPALSVEAYRDRDQAVYFEGLEPNEIFKVYYLPDPARRDRRYKSAWMYQTTSQFTCTVHHLWHSKKFPLLGDLTVLGTPFGDLNIQTYTLNYTSTENPCNGSSINLSLPWKDLGNGIKAISSTNSCLFQYNNGNSLGCVPASVVYIAGLPGAAYRVASSAGEVRMTKSNACGFLKLPNTQKWQAYPKDRFILKTGYSPGHERYQNYGTFNRGNLPYRDKLQIPRCFDGKRFVYEP